ncbi:type III intermediate filament [Chanos chanos]|uniref:Type III intermediate filament n=1 Tax=Chanos chanos TaxID=29144 RepID=A0A6J2UN06_CHACN|nr:type III intermediate filament-like [Chanos chanos]
MAMLRVSSYRRLFEEDQWSQTGAVSQRCGGQYLRSSARTAVSEWTEPDFAAARALNREGVTRFARERSLIAALNDRLANLIDVARCLEEENESLEAQIEELEERLKMEKESSTVSISRPDDSCLDAIVERLRREKEEILHDTELLRSELQSLQARHEDVVEQKTLLQLEREDVAVEVDEVTADCLALREQVAIYEEQLATMERQQATRLEMLSEPVDSDGSLGVALDFPAVDITPAIMDIKEYYCQLAESLQFESKAVTEGGLGKRDQLVEVTGGKVKDVSKETDVNALKDLITELQKELAELERHGEDLEAEIETKRETHLEEIAELEASAAGLEEELGDLQAQMKEQCGDYEELLSEKMALDIEIAAYRGLVEEEGKRLWYL